MGLVRRLLQCAMVKGCVKWMPTPDTSAGEALLLWESGGRQQTRGAVGKIWDPVCHQSFVKKMQDPK